MTAQGKAFLGQCLLPLVTGADTATFVQESFRFLGGGEPRELGSQRMLGSQEGLFAMQDGRIASVRIIPGSHPEGLKMHREGLGKRGVRVVLERRIVEVGTTRLEAVRFDDIGSLDPADIRPRTYPALEVASYKK